MKRRRTNPWVILLVIGAFIFVAIGIYAVSTLLAYQSDRDEYATLRDVKYATATPISDIPTSTAPTERSSEGTLFIPSPDSTKGIAQTAPQPKSANSLFRPTSVGFDALVSENPDTVAWIEISDTNIDYPVVQGLDDEFYLSHSFAGKSSKSGCVFLGTLYPADFSGVNSVLYGHHMKDGSMFHDLTLYKDKAFFEGHQTGTLYTPHGDYTLEIFSSYVVHSDGRFQNSGFTDSTEVNAFYQELADKSTSPAPFVPSWPDQILTLVTCSYEYNDARYVIHARMAPITQADGILSIGQ